MISRSWAVGIEGRDTDEVCATLNVTPGNLWDLLHRARKNLREAVDPDWRDYFVAASR